MNLGIIIVVGTIGFIILSFVFARVVSKRMMGTSKADEAKIERLMTTGSKARATLTAITPTGLTVNNFNVQVNVDFWLEPLDGSPPFEASKKIFCLETQFPRQGDIWPSWYDAADHSTFAVVHPASSIRSRSRSIGSSASSTRSTPDWRHRLAHSRSGGPIEGAPVR